MIDNGPANRALRRWAYPYPYPRAGVAMQPHKTSRLVVHPASRARAPLTSRGDSRAETEAQHGIAGYQD